MLAGSMRAARRAGTHAAIIATTNTDGATIIYASGSRAVELNTALTTFSAAGRGLLHSQGEALLYLAGAGGRGDRKLVGSSRRGGRRGVVGRGHASPATATQHKSHANNSDT